MDSSDSTRWSALPNDVLETVAFFLPASSDLFAFLQAVRRFHRLPPLLEHIWQLGRVKEHADLWPALKLSPVDATLEQIYREAFQHVAKFYQTIDVSACRTPEMQWLPSDAFSPKALWYVQSTDLSLCQSWRDATQGRLAMLTLDLRDGQVSGETLANVLAPLNHLKTLKLVVQDDALFGAVFAFAKSSVQLTHLEMDGCKHPLLTPSIGHNLIAWFGKQPVQVFKFPGWSVSVQHLDLLIAVETIVFNCATLEILECSTFLPWSDYSKLTFPMPTLTLRDLHSSQIHVAAAFVKSLAWSAVRHLALTNTVDPSRLRLRGIDTLFQMLDQTQIVTLELAGCRLGELEWSALAEHLPHYRRVEALSLVNVGLTSQYAEEIASAMLTNKSIQALDVGGNDLDSECIATLIHACTHPDRPGQMRWIRFQGCGIELQDYDDLDAFAKEQCIEQQSRIKK